MNSKRIVITSVLVAILVVGILTATYAYFQARIGTGSTTNATVTAKTIDGLTFNQGTNLSITATQTNFGSGKGNLSSSTSPTVTLKARNDAAASYNYKACLNITENTFVHSQVDETGTTNLTNNLCKPLTSSDWVLTGGAKIEDDKIILPNLDSVATFKIDWNKRGSKLYVTGNIDGTKFVFNTAYMDDSGTRLSGNGCNTLSNGKAKCLYGNSTPYSDYILASKTITLSIVRKSTYAPDEYSVKNIMCSASGFEEYDQYGSVTNPDLELTVTKNGTTVLTKDITHGTGEVCVPTTSGGNTTTHTISAAAGATTTDTWNATVTFKNYNNNQNVNLDKTFNSTFVFTRT